MHETKVDIHGKYRMWFWSVKEVQSKENSTYYLIQVYVKLTVIVPKRIENVFLKAWTLFSL